MNRLNLIVSIVIVLFSNLNDVVQSENQMPSIALGPSFNLISPIVSTKLGRIQGTRKSTFGFQFEEFLGIRYGLIPKRFSYSTVNSQSWTGVVQATSYGPKCTQIPFEGTSEDCLFINIWRPLHDVNRSSLLPVLLWVHGSGYQRGSGAQSPGDMIAAQGNIIVATINYRLGAFGYAYGDENEIPGNQGVSDVITALRWVNENIIYFGGDPERITLGGHSAGSMIGSIAPILSSLDDSLYSRLWLMSGASVNSMFIEDKTIALAKIKFLASKVGCGPVPGLGPLTSQIIECLQTVNASTLIERNQDADIKALGGAEVAAFIPIYGTSLIPKPLIDLFWSSLGSVRKTVIYQGIAKDESSQFWGDLQPTSKSEAYTMAWEKLSYIKKDLTSEQMKPLFDYYFNETADNDTKSLRTALDNFMNDYSFRCSSLALAEVYSSYHSVRFGEFQYILDKYGPEARPDGPWHSDSIELYFGDPFRPNPASRTFNMGTFSEQDKSLSARLIQSLAAYVNGRQTSDWPEIHFDQQEATKKPIIREIDLKDRNVEYEKQFICVQWAKLLDFDITLNATV